MKVFKATLLIGVFIAISSMVTPSYGLSRPFDVMSTEWTLTGQLTNTGQIKNGDTVTVEYTLTNIGPNYSDFVSPIYVILPTQMGFTSFSGPNGLECLPEQPLTENPSSWAYGRKLVYCAPNGAPMISMPIGTSIDFTVTGKALEDFSPGITKIYGMHIHSMDETAQNYWTSEQNVFELYPQAYLSTIQYSYTSPIPQTTASTTPNLVATNGSGVLGSNTTAAVGEPSDAGASGYSVQPQGSATIDTREVKPPTPSRSALLKTSPDPQTTWSEFIAKYRFQISSGTAGIMALGSLSVFLIRRSRKKHQSQRDYRHALTLMNHKRKNIKETDMSEYMPKINMHAANRTSIETLRVSLEMQDEMQTPSQN